jgi:uridine kinase
MSPAAVIAVAAPPGGGKTTLVRRLATRLGDAPTLHYDDYEQITKRSPAEVEAWLDRGAPASEVPLPNFAEALAGLKQGPARHVILDFLLARAHPATASHIDMLIWIDTPLDIALVRTLREQAGLARNAPPTAGFIDWLAGYLDSYARVMHRGYQLQRATVRPQADIILDGMLPPDRLAELAAAEILCRFP